MVMADLFPPGRVLWAIRDSDLSSSHRLNPQSPSPKPETQASKKTGDANANGNADTGSKVRLFEVLDVEKMFGQIIFARDMLR